MKCHNPACSNELHAAALSCPACGWDTPKGAKQLADHDPLWHRCSDSDRSGARCSKPGTLSESTRGGGPWFCHQHFPLFHNRYHPRTTPPPGWKGPTRTAALIAEDLAERFAIQSEGSP